MSDQTPSLDDVRDRYIQPQSQGEAMDPDAHYIVGEEFDRAIEQVRATARRDALNEAVGWLTEVVEDVQSSDRPNSVDWQTGALGMRDVLRAWSAAQ